MFEDHIKFVDIIKCLFIEFDLRTWVRKWCKGCQKCVESL